MMTWKSVDFPEPVLPATSACWRVPLPSARYCSFVAPVRLEAIRPQYTPEALRQKIQGPVTIEAVVGVDGAVEDARVTTSLDSTFGLDAQALDAVRRTPFRPATLNGTPVRCVVTFDLMFTLR